MTNRETATEGRGDSVSGERADPTTDLLVYVDRSSVRPGRLDELRDGMERLVAFVAANVPAILAYEVYFDAAGDRMTVLHVHDDPASLEHHLTVGAPEFLTVRAFLDIESIDVYGRPNDATRRLLREKAAALGRGTVTIHDRFDGFHRVSATTGGRVDA